MTEQGDTWALSATVTEEFLNALARNGVGPGIEATELRQQFNLPMLGAIDLGVTMTIVEVVFSMLTERDNRLHASIRATGDVKIYGDSMMPALPGLARVRGDVLVTPHIEYRADGSFVAVLDLAGSELVGMVFEGIDGVEANLEAQEMMGQMLFAAVGGELFSGLAEQMGSVGIELEPHDAVVFEELGVERMPAYVEILDGRMVVGLRAVEGLEGHASSAGLGATGVAVGVAAGALSALANRLAADTLGAPLPFDLDVTARDDRVGARIRNQRLVESGLLPDLRTGFRSTVRPRLAGDRLEISLREAWVELPLVPSAVNRLSRWVGGVASLAPLSVSIPAHVEVPVRPDSEAHLALRITDLAVGRDGVAFEVEAHL